MRRAMGAFLCASLLSGRAAAQSLDALAAKSAAGTYKEFVELLSIPNISAVPADIQKNTTFLDAAFKRRGFNTIVWPNGGRPLLFAEWPNASPNKKTVLFYMHLDGQPVTPSEWEQKSPFDPTLKRRVAQGKWETLPLERLYGGDVDPEWRLFARSAADDKGPIGMFLAAVDGLRSAGQEPAINVKVVLDPEEEGGGGRGWRSFIAERTSVLAADALVAFDGPQLEDNKPLLEFGFRGGASVRLTVFGAREEVHSGNYGNYAPNPLQKLARLVGNMKDDDGRVTIPGYYDSVKLDDETRKALDAAPANEAQLNERLGIAAREKIGRNLAEALLYPTLTVSRMVAGNFGPKGDVVPFVGAVIPAVAEATIAIRVVPETPVAYLRQIFTKYVELQGYHLVNQRPTEEERSKYANLAALVVSGNDGGIKTPINSAAADWMRRAYRKAFGSEPTRLPILGASLPLGAAVEALKVPLIISPLVNGDDNQHTSNENLRMGNYVSGTKSIIALLQEKF